MNINEYVSTDYELEEIKKRRIEKERSELLYENTFCLLLATVLFEIWVINFVALLSNFVMAIIIVIMSCLTLLLFITLVMLDSKKDSL